MNERRPNPGAPRTSAPTRIAFVVIACIAIVVHVRAARMRSAGLLEHDEAISLLAAAGASRQAAALYAGHLSPVAHSAESLQKLLRPTGDSGFAGVVSALRNFDIHPPLYFWLLHVAERVGVRSTTLLRMMGSLFLLVAAIVFDRLVWPLSNRLIRVLAFALILLSPSLVEAATELRQYALLLPAVAISIAALVRLSETSTRWGLTVAMIAIAPVLLLWTHFGAIVWLAIWTLLLAVLAWRSRRPQRLAVAIGLAVAALCIAPLVFIYAGVLAQRSAVTHGGALSPVTAAYDVLAGSAQLLVAMPWSIRTTWVAIAPTLAAFAIAAWLIRRRPFADKLLLAAAAIWMIAWMELLSLGKLPPHAVQPKYLVVPALAGLAVMMRCCTPSVGRAKQHIVTIGMGGMLLLNVIELPGALARPKNAHVANALHGVQTVVVNEPKRGYLFPIVNELPPTARVYIGQPMRLLHDADALGDPLLVLEIKPTPGQPSSADAIHLIDILQTQYERHEVLASGPRRRMTLFRDRRR